MKAFIVYCHPSEDSLTRNIRDEFIKGIVDSGNDYVLSDLSFSLEDRFIVKGFLLGTMDAHHNLHFDYRHINKSGESKSGSCVSTPKIENGKLRFYEKWQWTGGEKGTSVIEEM